VTDEHRVDGLWVQEMGDGPVVVLVHGAMDRSSSMLRVRRSLEEEFRVVRYDRRGYGRSLAAGPPSSFGQQVDDLAAVLGERRADVVMGHSLGGVVGLALAERSPERVGAVLAYEAPLMWEPWWPTDSAGAVALAAAARGGPAADGPATDGEAAGQHGGDAAEAFLRRMLGDARWERLPAAVRDERRSEGATLLAELRSVHPPSPVPYHPEAVAVPVIAAHGSESKPQHRQGAVELARRAPLGVLEVVEGAGHGAHLTHQEAVAGLVRRCLSRAQGPR